MSKKMTIRFLALTCVAALVGGALAGCQSPVTGATDAQQENRTYMTKVNVAVEKLNEGLAAFDDAVAEGGNPVIMRTQADKALDALNELSAIEAPEAMADLQSGYTAGCEKLKDALNSYIDLYTEIDSATDEAPFDYATYDDRLKAIQDAYNEGIEKLKAADEEALKLNED